MSTKKTPNYQLNQWVKSDQVLMDEFNADNSKIDSGMKALDGRITSLTTTVNGKASQSALNSLTTTVNGKASQSSLDALDSRVTSLTSTVNTKASQSALNTVKNQMAQLGNCQVEMLSYTGKGGFGANAPTTITFKKKPVFFMIMSGTYFAIGSGMRTTVSLDLSTNNSVASATWSGSQVSFSANSESSQMNTKGNTYYVLALYAQDQ